MLVGYIVKFLVFDREKIIDNPYNTRIELLAAKTLRGTIYGRNGEVLAETIIDLEGNDKRSYPYGSLFVHTVGYNTYGKAGLEYYMNYELLTSKTGIFQKILNDFEGKKDIGNSVHTTLDAKLQRAVYDAFGEYKGAAVVLDVATGKILAMVSKPDFDPNRIDELWDVLVKDKKSDGSKAYDGAMLNRATQGKYTPGSVFKIITALAYIRENPDTWQDFNYTCMGEYTEGSNKVKCYHGTKHGRVNLDKAFAVSCNSAFAMLGGSVSYDTFKAVCEELSMNKMIASETVMSEISRFALSEDSPRYEYLYTMIGQGQTTVTPLYAAMLAAAVANGGTAMSPYLVEKVLSPEGEIVKSYIPDVIGEWMSSSEAEALSKMMRECVTDGTGNKLKELGVECYGKTGTAETSKDRPDAWFAGFAKNGMGDDIAVCVVVEESGTGAEIAVPIVKSIMENYYEK